MGISRQLRIKGDFMKAIHFGAGSIGRGFIGEVLHKNNIETTFVDAYDKVIDQINADKGYAIRYLDEANTEHWIDNVMAMHINDPAISEVINNSQLLTTAIGVPNLEKIAPIIKAGILERNAQKPLVVIANENVMYATNILKEAIKNVSEPDEWQEIEKNTLFLNSAIDRQASTIDENGKLLPVVEPFFEWVIEKDANFNQLQHVKYVENMEYYIKRKLFIVNATHAAFAYIGNVFSYRTIQDAMDDQRIVGLVTNIINENMQIFVNEYGDDINELRDYFNSILERFGNKKLNDSVKRVGRNPRRKLSKDERIISPIRSLFELGLPYANSLKLVVSALLFRDENDDEANYIEKIIEENGIDEAVPHLLALPEELLDEIISEYKVVVEDTNLLLD